MRSTSATVLAMARTVTQRQLRNESGEIMRALDDGESFVVTRNGVAVGELTPIRPARRSFVPIDEVLDAFASAPAIDFQRFREDIDLILDQDFEPRA